MKKLLLIPFLLLPLACGDDDDVTPGGPSLEKQIRDCIEQGGNPEFTTYEGGAVREYFGCVMP